MNQIVVAIQGAAGVEDVPGIERVADRVELRFAADDQALEATIGDAEVLLGWNFRARVLREVWPKAKRLRWVQWSGAGVDAVLFPEFANSDVVLTNMRGVFDRAMAEYTLGLILALAKSLPETLQLQAQQTWHHRLTECVHGRRALIVGVGSIGREIARLLRACGLEVSGVGRTHREEDRDFDVVYGSDELLNALADADYVVVVVPSTAASRNMLGAAEFGAMKSTAHLINLARGDILDEPALCAALSTGVIAGAALDVFATEPLPASSPLWTLSNVIVSPHMSGDHLDHKRDMANLFVDNLERYLGDQPLVNVVDKTLGFVTGP